MRKCIKCFQERPEEDFYKCKRGTYNRGDCKDCVKKFQKAYYETNKEAISKQVKGYRLFYKYSLTPEDYQNMLDAQKGLCGMCDKPMKEIMIDHCHKTGKVRSLLCRRCNTALGFIEDDELKLLSANYLSRF